MFDFVTLSRIFFISCALVLMYDSILYIQTATYGVPSAHACVTKTYYIFLIYCNMMTTSGVFSDIAHLWCSYIQKITELTCLYLKDQTRKALC